MGPAGFPAGVSPPTRSQTEAEQAKRAEQESSDSQLRSANEFIGYYIEATDGDIGHVEEFIIDDESWAIRYMVVDTRNWWPGKKVVVAPQWIERASWSDSRLYMNVSRNKIEQAPEYDANMLLSREYETSLYRHYGRAPYWD